VAVKLEVEVPVTVQLLQLSRLQLTHAGPADKFRKPVPALQVVGVPTAEQEAALVSVHAVQVPETKRYPALQTVSTVALVQLAALVLQAVQAEIALLVKVGKKPGKQAVATVPVPLHATAFATQAAPPVQFIPVEFNLESLKMTPTLH